VNTFCCRAVESQHAMICFFADNDEGAGLTVIPILAFSMRSCCIDLLLSAAHCIMLPALDSLTTCLYESAVHVSSNTGRSEVIVICCLSKGSCCAMRHSPWFAEQGPSDNTVPLLQLPHFDQDLLKRLNRKRVKALQDLFCMPAHERREVYGFGGG